MIVNCSGIKHMFIKFDEIIFVIDVSQYCRGNGISNPYKIGKNKICYTFTTIYIRDMASCTCRQVVKFEILFKTPNILMK